MATKIFFYTLRPYDELGIAQRLAPQLDVEFGSTQEYPTLENAELAKGYDAVSVTPCDMSAPMVKRFHELGVKSICCRSIGYDHVDRETARELVPVIPSTPKRFCYASWTAWSLTYRKTASGLTTSC